MEKESLTIQIDTDIKEQAQALFIKLGLDLPTAVNIFLCQSIREQKIPFVIQAQLPGAEPLAQGGRESYWEWLRRHAYSNPILR